MTIASFRTALRAHTSDRHARLDSAVGLFDTAEQYGAYLDASYRFRKATEWALRDFAGWSVAPLAGLIGDDLADLGRGVPAATGLPPPPDDAFALGMAYVLEGSALGARLLERRAAGLGFDERHGARHLAAQISDKRRWPDFLARLEAVQPGARDDVIAGAASTFDFALDIYAGEPA
ncbi:MAG: hypothetical protein DI569_05900 [Sphingopyxis macrogoltabida]|uniref:Heme oxygenase n=1 Tax=Sphingopyxis macrogoltabida TaxID=33050 RepID=A0A2W5L0W4_SPHMC|nr:MAG: hypothetical protein DI569_05900 [Sphingopyxis macrogoltabida]